MRPVALIRRTGAERCPSDHVAPATRQCHRLRGAAEKTSTLINEIAASRPVAFNESTNAQIKTHVQIEDKTLLNGLTSRSGARWRPYGPNGPASRPVYVIAGRRTTKSSRRILLEGENILDRSLRGAAKGVLAQYRSKFRVSPP